MIKSDLLTYLKLANPWLDKKSAPIFADSHYIPRIQTEELLKPHWNQYITILTGPRQAGKTTLGRYLCQILIDQKKYPTALYLNCDELLVREWLKGSYVLQDIQSLLGSSQYILFIDEIQRIENPGLLLKSIHDLKLPIKIIASGSSQLEMKSKVQEFLTGRHLESLILPFSYLELGNQIQVETNVIYGCYPQIILENEKIILLARLFQNYFNKDIIEILKIRQPDTLLKLLTLIAHSTGQLINYQQLATDCGVSSHTIQHYLGILENTYVISGIKPFVGNKRTEITSNPIYYFIDNGFRNQALNNFSSLDTRTDFGFLIQSAVYQELYKFIVQHYLTINLYYWRTKSGAEVDFIFYKNEHHFIPIEVKYRNLTTPTVSRGYRSFLQAYQPKKGIMITKDWHGEMMIENSLIHFIPFSDMPRILALLKELNDE